MPPKRFLDLTMLPPREGAEHLARLAAKLEARALVRDAGGRAAAVLASRLRQEVEETRAALAAPPSIAIRRERVADRFVLHAPGGRRFVARRRQDKGQGWALADEAGFSWGNHATLDACEAVIAAALGRSD